jgi:dephospho-CoA kinase
VVDADIIAKQALQPNSWAWRRLKQRVSPQLWQSIVDHEGNIRRAELRQQMFQDSNLRHALNSATHLPIIVEILKQLYWNRIFHPTKLVVLDAPLLLETRLDWMCHTVLVVACNPEQQIERVMARDGVDHEQASNALNSQMALQDKLQRASVVLDNTQSIDLLHKQVATWLVNAQRVW